MVLQFCSDLHLEFPENKAFLKMRPLQPKAKILLLAGDIVPYHALERHRDFFDYVSDHFEQTYWIPGNHEYYGGDVAERSGKFREKIRNNVDLLNNMVVDDEDARLVFTTLWSRISLRYKWDIERGLNDYSLIKFRGARLTADDVNHLHADAISFVNSVVAEKTIKKTVVITHHVPTFLDYPAMYKGNKLSEAFGTELFEWIHDAGFAHWIYGHHHHNVADFSIGNTLLSTNQLGYVRFNEHRSFSGDRTIGL
jgi:predicted phosphohydrolase